MLFPCKRLDRAHACKILLRHGCQHGIFLTDVLVNLVELALHDDRDRTAQDHCGKRHERQLPVERKHAVQYHGHMNDNLDDKHAHIAHRIPDFIHVILDTRHQFSRVRVLKISHGQRLDMVEQILAHCRSDLGCQYVERELLAVAENTPADSHDHDSNQKFRQKLQFSAYDDIIHNLLCDLRIQHIQNDRRHHRKHRKQIPIPIASDIGV